ncbi:MAG: protein kinase [Candidatus Sulfomarinibacteraceae bacterium]
MIGTTLGHYRIVRKLGAGGMGEVYLAEDDRLERSVAVKILPPELAEDGDRRSRFEAEAKAASAINHPNITHIYDVGEADGVHFIAMEFVDGDDLGDKLGSAPLGVDEILDIGAQTADALAEAHDRGIVHRDIKPGNIMIDPRGRVRVLDFGLAKLRPSALDEADDQAVTETMTQPGTVVGTVRYMSPEQALGKPIDARSDIFSLGVVLYELATGNPPFRGETPTETITKITRDQPAPIGSINRPAAGELERIVGKCLEKEPGRRYQSARELAVDLENLKRDSSPAFDLPRSRGPGIGRRRWFIAAAAIAAIAAVATGVALLRPDGQDIESLAVLPFENGTGDADADYLCDGLTETLIASMSALPDLRVISRRSSFTFKESTDDPTTIARSLDVDGLVMGRVTKHGGELVVSAELVRAADNRQLWGDRFEQAEGDLLAIERDLSAALVQTLGVDLPDEVVSQRARRYDVDPEAHQLYLRARQLLVGSTREMDTAVDFLKQAIAIDPDYALAHAQLGRAYLLRAYHSVMERDEAIELARAEVERALAIDDQLAEGHAVSAEIKYLFDWDWAGADRDLRRAVELDPGSDTVHLIYADFLAAMGRFDEAIAESEKAKKLDPLSPSAAHMLAFSLMGTRDYERAAAEFRAAIDLNPNWTWGYIKLSKTLADDGRCDEALATAEEAEAQLHGGSTPLARAWLGYTYATCGDLERGNAALDELDRMAADGYVDPGVYAELYTALGTMDQVLDNLELTVAERSPDAIYLPVIPDYFLPELADEPRYQALLEQMNLPPHPSTRSEGR